MIRNRWDRLGYLASASVAACAPLLAADSTGVAASDEQAKTEQAAALAPYFGFRELQIYKLQPSISDLRAADLNGDGRNDLCLWNQYKNRFEVFYQPAAGAVAAPVRAASERNDLLDRGPLRSTPIPVAYNVAVMEIGDVTGDKRNDIVFFGEPKELVVLAGLAEGGFAPPSAVRVPDGAPRPATLALADFTGDQRTDIAMLGDEQLLIFAQQSDGRLASPQRIIHTITNPLIMLAADVDGDGRSDLAISADDEQYGMFLLLQQPEGGFGPIRRVRIPKLRSVTFAGPREGERGADLFSIEQVSGRLLHYRWETPAGSGSSEWPQRIHTFPSTTKSKRQPLAIGDITGDGRADVVSAAAEGAQLFLVEETPAGLKAASAHPSLLKASDLQIVPAAGDKPATILITSPEEKMVGEARYENGRITFPTPVPVRGKPFTAAYGSEAAGGPTTHLAYVAKDDKDFEIVVRRIDDVKEESAARIKPAGMKDDPAMIRFFDINQDGKNDLLLFVKFSPLLAFLQTDKGYEQLQGPAAREGLVREAPIEGMAFGDVDGDGKIELLLAQKSFVRALRITDGSWTVVEQFNPPRADSELAGVSVAPAASGKRPTVRCYDRKRSELLTFEPGEAGGYALSDTQSVPALDLIGMAELVTPGEASASRRVLLVDANKMVSLAPEPSAKTFVMQHSYEHEKPEAFLADSVIGDLNGDRVRDVVVLNQSQAGVDVLTTMPDGNLARALRFQVFQGKRFAEAPDGRGEPREAIIADVTGDGVDDLSMIVHDRLLIYPGM
ncbi:MAG: VCBS repeat-containing protein [Phycisphaerae bacterium]|nr:VCBS repeat-containing protein [Phycisphaerae bacterium]